MLLVTHDRRTNRGLRTAFAATAPQFRLDIASSRAEIEWLEIPALLLLDLVPLHEPALEVLRWWRAEPRYARVPVIALGSDRTERHMSRAYALGANSCVLKTLAPQSLSSLVRGIASYAAYHSTLQ